MSAEVVGSNPTNADVFVYTGEGGVDVPQNVVRVRVDPSVRSIPASAFYGRKKLAEVELCEGLVEIGRSSFGWCDHSITKINIPNELRKIGVLAFVSSLQCPIRLHDGIASIGNDAYALIHCWCLRNVAFPPNADLVAEIFFDEDDEMYYHTDLQRLFGNSNAAIIREILHRFDGLPIHSLVYYQSYYQGVLQILLDATNTRSGQRRTLRSKLDPTGNQQDCLGMTPLHILACSSVHDLELYRLIVEKYPANLITEDRWGALPLLYAFWGAAPAEIIQFLLESYQSLYPDHVFNWTMMVETMGRCDTPKESIENLLHVRQMHFPGQSIDWEYLLDKFAVPTKRSFDGALFQERMQYLVMCGLSEHVEALPFKVWRDCISNMIQTSNFKYYGDNLVILRRIRSRIAHFEDELPKFEEVSMILELALWKMRMTVNETFHQEIPCRRQKKVKTDESSTRQQCRVTCGADVVIGHVLPFLITAEIDESCSDSDSESESQDGNPTAPNCSIS
jgi:hypothetical protein